MSVESREPWSGLISLRDAMDRLLERSIVLPRASRQLSGDMLINMREEPDQYLVTALLPGAKPEDIDVRVSGSLLEISAEVREETAEPAGRWILRERRTGRFERNLTMPAPVDVDRIEADYTHGVLTVRLPKAAEATPRSVPVRRGGALTTGTTEQIETQPGVETRGRVVREAGIPPAERASAEAAGPAHPPGPAGETTMAVPEEPTRAMVDPSQIHPGMEVVGLRDTRIGTVKEVREHDFLVDRLLQRDVYVPFDAVQAIERSRVILNLRPSQVDAMDWDKPSMTG